MIFRLSSHLPPLAVWHFSFFMSIMILLSIPMVLFAESSVHSFEFCTESVNSYCFRENLFLSRFSICKIFGWIIKHFDVLLPTISWNNVRVASYLLIRKEVPSTIWPTFRETERRRWITLNRVLQENMMPFILFPFFNLFRKFQFLHGRWIYFQFS